MQRSLESERVRRVEGARMAQSSVFACVSLDPAQ